VDNINPELSRKGSHPSPCREVNASEPEQERYGCVALFVRLNSKVSTQFFCSYLGKKI